MDELTNIEVSPEEQTAEQEALREAEIPESDMRAKLAEKFSIDPETQSEILDKVVENEKQHRKSLSSTIKQKIKYRDQAKATKPNINKDGDKPINVDEIQRIADERAELRLAERDLKSLNLSDELTEEVRTLAKLKNISVMEAAQNPYILSKKKEAEDEKRITEASPKRGGKGYSSIIKDTSKPLDPDEFDLNTKEGQDAWNQAKANRARARS